MNALQPVNEAKSVQLWNGDELIWHGIPVLPTPVNAPVNAWYPEPEDKPFRFLGDHSFEDRDTPLAETNQTVVLRPWDRERKRFAVTGKNTVDLERGGRTPFLSAMEWQIGSRNFENLLGDGDGLFDTAARFVMTVLRYGNGLGNGLGTHYQSGTNYEFVEMMDASLAPYMDSVGNWYYRGQMATPDIMPHLLTARNYRRVTKQITPCTPTGINYNAHTKKGDEWLCSVTDVPMGIEHMKIWFYPEVPFVTSLSKDSYVVDGYWKIVNEKLDVAIFQLAFDQSRVYGRDEKNNWWVLEEMLVRGTPDTGEHGTIFDWRVYASALIRDRRASPTPVRGWTRQYSPFWNFLVKLSNQRHKAVRSLKTGDQKGYNPALGC